MADNISEQLDDVIEKRLKEFDYYDLDSENTKQAVEAIEKLYKLKIEERKVEGELYEKQKTRENEEDVKNKELHEKRVDRWVNGAITVASTAASLVFYGIWMNKGFKFEETGSFTSTTFKGLFNRFRPMK
jgi:hypothetical protein